MGRIGGHTTFMPSSKIGKVLAGALTGKGLLVFSLILVFYFGPIYSPFAWAPEQPIPFSHKLHAGDNKIDCQYCHSYARRSEMAGIPAVKTCMNCHVNVKTEAPNIVKVTEYFESGKPIEWIRVYDAPDHVWFNHKRHIKKDIKCQECHGPVETMEVMSQQVAHRMGFCLKCHQKNEAPTDCWTCHT